MNVDIFLNKAIVDSYRPHNLFDECEMLGMYADLARLMVMIKFRIEIQTCLNYKVMYLHTACLPRNMPIPGTSYY